MGKLGSSFMALAMSSLLLSAGAMVPDIGDAGHADAARQPRPQVAQRELRKYKGFEHSPLYERAHQLIYGNTNGRLGPDGRVRIAVIVNGDENIVVEDRVKNEIYAQLRFKFPRESLAVMKGNDVNTKLLQYAEDIYYDDREAATTYDTRYDISSNGMSVDLSVGREMAYSDVAAGANDADTSAGASGSGSTRINSIGGGIQIGPRSKSIHRVKRAKTSKVDVDGMPVGMQPRGLSDMRREDYARAGQECGYDYVFVVSFSNGDHQINNHNYILFNTTSVRKNVWMRVRLVDVASGDYLYRNNIVAEGLTHNGTVGGRVMQRAVHKAMTEAMNDLDFE